MRLEFVRICAFLAATLLAGCEFGVEGMPPPGADYRHARSSAGNGISGGHLSFVTNYEQGYRQARSEGKPMLVFFTASWCKFCHQMADEAFTHPLVVSLSGHFVCILVDADAEPAVCRQFQVTGFPTIQFLSALQNVARNTDEPETPVR